MHSEALFSRMYTHLYSKLDKTTTHLYRTWTASDCTPTCEFFGASAGQTGEQRLGYFRCSAADLLSLKSAMQQVHYKYGHTPSLTHIHTFTHTHTPTHTFTHTHTRHSGTRKQATTHICARPHAQVHMRTHTFPLFQAHIHLDGYSRCERRGGLSGNVRPKKIHCTPLCTTRQKCMCTYQKSHTRTNMRPFLFSLSLAVLFFLSLSLLSSLPISFPFFGSRDLCQSICSSLSTLPAYTRSLLFSLYFFFPLSFSFFQCLFITPQFFFFFSLSLSLLLSLFFFTRSVCISFSHCPTLFFKPSFSHCLFFNFPILSRFLLCFLFLPLSPSLSLSFVFFFLLLLRSKAPPNCKLFRLSCCQILVCSYMQISSDDKFKMIHFVCVFCFSCPRATHPGLCRARLVDSANTLIYLIPKLHSLCWGCFLERLNPNGFNLGIHVFLNVYKIYM